MKRNLLAIIPQVLVIVACGQKAPVLHGYAFQRVTIPAVRTTSITEGTSTEIQRPVREKVTSFIFVEHKASVNIRPSLLWLYGVPYQVSFEKVKDQTVIITRTSVTGRFVPDTLVKKTVNPLISISPTERLNVAKPASFAKKITKNNAVLEYYVKGKKYFYIFPSIKNLEPLTLQ